MKKIFTPHPYIGTDSAYVMEIIEFGMVTTIDNTSLGQDRMRTFFYTAKHSRCEIPCSNKLCVCKCLEMLNSLLSVGELVILPGGSRLNCDSSMMMRTGDLVILYAADSYDLDDLIDSREIFDPFRVVLVFGNDHLLTSFNYHLLKPRFLTSLTGNSEKLDAVLWKMKERNLGSAQLGLS